MLEHEQTNEGKQEAKTNVKSTNEVDIAIGKKLSQLRTSSGRTRKELAASIGITHQQLQKYEQGINRISASRLAYTAGLLNVPVSVFFDEFSGSFESNNHSSMGMLQDFLNIKKPEQQEAIRQIVKALANDDLASTS